MGSRTLLGHLPGVAMVLLLLLLLLQGTQSVYIKYQGFQVQLESVKKLKDLEGQWVPSPRLQAQRPLPLVCYHPALPLDLQPVCASQDAARIIQGFRSIDNDECELCVNIACTGC
ncbi:Guanylate cyclase activator 2B [Heterocephalus glaber]|uniref:Guanylate cyclase activator 2B n=1 Tax=Heterocephalus glaber TaxID=10181 RepID=G5AQJ2_HETGA|nr:guanylate cyclase activator 2B [Heterocephalus glaber]EHA99302.1 Guanylate cyclase activator 2B [Heterocephalus glaber]